MSSDKQPFTAPGMAKERRQFLAFAEACLAFAVDSELMRFGVV